MVVPVCFLRWERWAETGLEEKPRLFADGSDSLASLVDLFFFFFLRFYLFIHERHRKRRRHRQREKQASGGEPDVGIDPRTPGS